MAAIGASLVSGLLLSGRVEASELGETEQGSASSSSSSSITSMPTLDPSPSSSSGLDAQTDSSTTGPDCAAAPGQENVGVCTQQEVTP